TGFGDRTFQLDVQFDAFGSEENGVLVSYGRRAAGFVLFLEQGRAVFDRSRASEQTIVSAMMPALSGTETITLALYHQQKRCLGLGAGARSWEQMLSQE